MKTKLLLFFTGTMQLLAAQSTNSNLESELYGFKLMQYREAVTNAFEDPIETKTYEDGFEMEAYELSQEENIYILFEYPEWNKEIIWSIQIYAPDSDFDPHFKGLKMGMPETELLEKIGKPDTIIDVQEYGRRWEYNNRNYSFEVNNNKLTSIKLMDYYDELGSKEDLEKFPGFTGVKNTLSSGDRTEIAALLAPDMEIYMGDKVLFFNHQWQQEIESDSSGMFKVLEGVAAELRKTNPENKDSYEENFRAKEGAGIMMVMKFQNNPNLKEIVIRWQLGKYLIWEIQL